MNSLIRQTEKYLDETLGITMNARKWSEEDSLPFFLRNLYHFYQASLFDMPCLLMLAQQEDEQTPATVRKHLLAVDEKWHGLIIYAHPRVSS